MTAANTVTCRRPHTVSDFPSITSLHASMGERQHFKIARSPVFVVMPTRGRISRASIREPVRSYGSFIHGVTSGSSISDGEAPCSLGKLPSLAPPSSCSASTIPESLAFARLSWLRAPFRFSSDPRRSARANFSQAQKLFAAKIGLTRDKCASGGRSQAVSRGARRGRK